MIEENNSITFIVLGKPPRKSNSRRIVRAGAKPLLIKSAEALSYVDSFILQVRNQVSIETPLGSPSMLLKIEVIVWYPSRRSDLSIELIKDALEKAGVVSNDRYIVEEHVWGFIDKVNPRAKIRLTIIDKERIEPF